MILNKKISDEAILFVKNNKNDIKINFTKGGDCERGEKPISIFMAGSPGAGKTEFSKRFLEQTKIDMVRIDADDVRDFMPYYDGKNSADVQRASALAVEYLYDEVLSKKKHMILDATFADYDKSHQNIKRSLDKKRHVEIYYLYQDPLVAWEFTKAREEIEGRIVPQDVFVDSFFKARENVNKVKKEFGDKVQLNLVIKNYDNSFEKLKLNVGNVDGYLDLSYDYTSLMEKLWIAQNSSTCLQVKRKSL